jgi:hypothetical protein
MSRTGIPACLGLGFARGALENREAISLTSWLQPGEQNGELKGNRFKGFVAGIDEKPLERVLRRFANRGHRAEAAV